MHERLSRDKQPLASITAHEWPHWCSKFAQTGQTGLAASEALDWGPGGHSSDTNACLAGETDLDKLPLAAREVVTWLHHGAAHQHRKLESSSATQASQPETVDDHNFAEFEFGLLVYS